MKGNRKGIIVVALLIFCLLLHMYGLDENRVESSYSNGFYQPVSRFLRFITGKLPFSIGDMFYGLLTSWLIWQVFQFFRRVFKKEDKISKRAYNRMASYRFLLFCCYIYIIFNVLWGVNYNRKGIGYQVGLEKAAYSGTELATINRLLCGKINSSKKQLEAAHTGYPANRDLFNMVEAAYRKLGTGYPYLKYEPVSIKPSMWGWLGNYTGFTGYYNPFTGEAQVNTTIPRFLHPFIACHEVAHQLGYAKENEASFVGYLAAKASGNALLQYSTYLDIFIHANRNLYYADSVAAKKYRDSLAPAVVADLKTWAEFNHNHRSFAEPLISWIYDKYLKGNRQPEGLLSYDEVTGFIINYYKKFGEI